MKRMYLVFAMVSMSLMVFAQNGGLDSFFNRYSGMDGFTTITINGSLLGLFCHIDDDKDLENLSDKVTSIRIICTEKEKDHPKVNFSAELSNVVKNGGYEELMKVKNSDDDVLILLKTEGETIREILLIASGDDEAVVHIKGSFKDSDLESLSRTHIDGLECLEELEKAGK